MSDHPRMLTLPDSDGDTVSLRIEWCTNSRTLVKVCADDTDDTGPWLALDETDTRLLINILEITLRDTEE